MWGFLVVCVICVTIYNLAYLCFDYLKFEEKHFTKDNEDEY